MDWVSHVNHPRLSANLGLRQWQEARDNGSRVLVSGSAGHLI